MSSTPGGIRRKVAGAGVMLLGLAGMSIGFAGTAGSASAAPDLTKVVVCKYVGTPPGELDHVVVVDDHSLPTGFDDEFPFEWTDAHGKTLEGSIAIRWADAGPPPEQASSIPLTECPTDGPTTTPTTPTTPIETAPTEASSTPIETAPTEASVPGPKDETEGDEPEVLGIAKKAPVAAPTAVAAGSGDVESGRNAALWIVLGAALVVVGLALGFVPVSSAGKHKL